MTATPLVHLSGNGFDVIVDPGNTTAPSVLYWGAPLGQASPESTLLATRPTKELGTTHPPLTIIPEHGSGHHGHPGIVGSRQDGSDWAPRFATNNVKVSSDAKSVVIDTCDPVAQLQQRISISVEHTLEISVSVTNVGTSDYNLHALTPTLPLPSHASELLMFDGRWPLEFQENRIDWNRGQVLQENRRGRTSHENPPLLFAGTAGFDEWSGSVWGLHIAWSGNHTMLAERLSDGRRLLQAGELLHPGEIQLKPQQTYTSPTLIGVFSPSGLTKASQAFHRHLRARQSHPRSIRPVTLNTWEAVYFDHDAAKLSALADTAAALGVERFVLDDGWFGSRRDDTSGLGDWTVSPDAHPNGLDPLIDHVIGLGMEFGIWVEPEMVNPDSDLFRAHPDWALATEGYDPVMQRSQLVLDLTNRSAFAHVFGQLDALFADHDISFVKWDMNRDLVAASDPHGRAATHTQTQAVYRLFDALRETHPSIEFESCSSGGARIDFAVLDRSERVWTSDCNDAIDRQRIQRGASMLIPPELMGAHIGPPRAHTTGRHQSLVFRATTAVFGHLGIEWDVTEINDTPAFEQLRSAISFYKNYRWLLHSGDVVRFNRDDRSIAHGVYTRDLSHGLVSIAQLDSGSTLAPDPLVLPGLIPESVYSVKVRSVLGRLGKSGHPDPAWMSVSNFKLTGSQLASHGLAMPVLYPGWALLVELEALPVEALPVESI